MENKAIMNEEGYIELVVAGDQTEETFEDLYKQAEPLLAQMKEEGRMLLGLINMEKEGAFSNDSNKAALQLLERIEYDKLAMYGAPVSEVAKLIIIAMGKSGNTRVFDSRKQAVDWLLRDVVREPVHPAGL